MEEVLAHLEACITTLDNLSPTRGKAEMSIPSLSEGYESMVKIDGRPILPPLMTPERRVEMRTYKTKAVMKERRRQEKRQEELVAKMEFIVKSYEESKENSPQQSSSQNAEMVVNDLQKNEAATSNAGKDTAPQSDHSYSPQKYMDIGKEEWNVRPTTPSWKRIKAKPRPEVAAKFDTRVGNKLMSSSMKHGRSLQQAFVRGLTPDLSVISSVSSHQSSTPPSANHTALDQNQVIAVPAVGDDTNVALKDCRSTLSRTVAPQVHSNIDANRVNVKADEVSNKTRPQVPVSGEMRNNDSLKDQLDSVRVAGNGKVDTGGVQASTGSQSNSNSSSASLNQTVIDLSHMSLAQHQTDEVEHQLSPSEKIQVSPLPFIDGYGKKADEERNNNVGDLLRSDDVKEELNPAPYLSDTESYLSLLGEYSLLPSSRKERNQSPFFRDPTSPQPANEVVTAGHKDTQGGEKSEGVFSANADLVGLRTATPSEWSTSSLGTLAQSCTLPTSLSSMTSESTLQGVDELWDRAGYAATPVTPQFITDGIISAEIVRTGPSGQVVDDAPLVSAKEYPLNVERKASEPVPNTVINSMNMIIQDQRSEVKVQSADERSGVKVESEFQTPARQHMRKSSYTVDFPSPALLDAEARHQAPHIAGADTSSTGTPEKHSSEASGKPAEQATTTPEQTITSGTEKLPTTDLVSDMRELKLDKESEGRVLTIQLSYLENLQERLQHQHQEQMQDLMLQQTKELQLLEYEMEDVRRKATASTLGHREEDTEAEKHMFKDATSGGDKTTSEPDWDRTNQILHSQPAPVEKEVIYSNRRSPGSYPCNRLNPPPSPNSRKRRFDGSSTDDLIEVPGSYLKPSSLMGDSSPLQFLFKSPSPVAASFSNHIKMAVTPKESLEGDRTAEGGLVEVPPSYISTSSGKKKNAFHNQSTTTPPDMSKKPGSVHGRKPTQLTVGLANEELTHSDSSTWLSSIHVGDAAGADDPVVGDGTHSDSFFLSESQATEAPALRQEQTNKHDIDIKQWKNSTCDRLSAGVKGYLTRALMRTPKVTAIVKTIKDTHSFLRQFQAETPVKRGKLSEQDMKLAHRVLAQLRAAQFELQDIFHVYRTRQRMAILRHAREKDRENFFAKKISPASAGEKMKHLSAATIKVMERRLQHAKEGDESQAGPKRQKLVHADQRPKSAAEARVLKPLQGATLTSRPASAVPPRTSSSVAAQKPNLCGSIGSSKPFPTKPVVVSRISSRAARSPSRPSSKLTSSRPASRPASGPAHRPTSGLTARPASAVRQIPQIKSPSSTNQTRAGARSSVPPSKSKGARRSLYPVAMAGSKKPQLAKQESINKK